MGEIDTPRLDAHVCFDLYAASRTVTNAYRPTLDAFGLTYPQCLVMIVLWDNGTSTVREIVDALRLDQAPSPPRRRDASARHPVALRHVGRDGAR